MEDYRNQSPAGSLRLGTFFLLANKKNISEPKNQTSWSVHLFQNTIPIAK
jgi:hypothetical protein